MSSAIMADVSGLRLVSGGCADLSGPLLTQWQSTQIACRMSANLPCWDTMFRHEGCCLGDGNLEANAN